MIADRTGPWPHYLVLSHSRRLPGAIRAEGACLSLARGYLVLIGRKNPLSSIRRHG
jgi:hypothetical protein